MSETTTTTRKARAKKSTGPIDMNTSIDKIVPLFKSKEPKAAIFMHQTPDPDAIGSAVGLQYLLKHKYKVESDIFYAGEVSHRQNQTLMNVLSFSFYGPDHYGKNKKSYDAGICVDCNPSNVFIEGVDDSTIDLVIDHHKIETSNNSVVYDVRNCGSCATIIADLMREIDCLTKGDEGKTVATAMIVGMRTDTNDLLSANMTDLDFDAYKNILALADGQKITMIVNYPKASYYFELLSKVIAESTIKNTTYIASVGLISEAKRDVLPSIADEIVRMEGISTSIIFGIVNDRISVSVRSEDVTLDVNAFCKKIFGDEFSGGKYGSGGASIPLGFFGGIASEPDAVKDKTVDAIKTKLTHIIEKEVTSE